MQTIEATVTITCDMKACAIPCVDAPVEAGAELGAVSAV
jgi:hypothetical protein